MLVRIGDRIEPNQPLARIFARSRQAAEQAARELRAAMTIVEHPIPPLPLIYPL